MRSDRAESNEEAKARRENGVSAGQELAAERSIDLRSRVSPPPNVHLNPMGTLLLYGKVHRHYRVQYN